MAGADLQALASHGLWPAHPLRGRILGEVHARPFRLIATPRVFLHYAFQTPPASAHVDRAFLQEFCRRHGAEGPGPDAKVYQIQVAGGTLRWEQFTEITTYTFDCALKPGAGPFSPVASDPFGAGFRAPGELLVATRLDLVTEAMVPPESGGPMAHFEEVWVSASQVVDRTALIITDFRVDRDGRTRILIVDQGLHARQAGALVQRLLEIETYRTFAMLGLPEAQAQGPLISRIERQMVDIAGAARDSEGLEKNRTLLNNISNLSAEIEAAAAETAYRFGASRAYDEIVGLRLAAIREEPFEGYSTWGAFLARRTAPAMRTLQSIQDRQQDLSVKLGRAANLLRTRVDVELEQQNRELLESMNRRARLQLRLQQTVEGLSVAAVSYYIVGLVGYFAKGGHFVGLELDPALVTALSVIPVMLLVWWTVQRIRKKHTGEDHG
ncbi:DUF3422 family protein [Chthonobacter albigriseus]|uniref:DUF3422 family protein n=1 Tax=Chthonobacter albigriseus TaxID=1683161 RepID=UPI0015EFA59A|nr:DUF3422 domain-containing protein [Chthonobacter albigriseus]